jgi:hypothetical protein
MDLFWVQISKASAPVQAMKEKSANVLYFSISG